MNVDICECHFNYYPWKRQDFHIHKYMNSHFLLTDFIRGVKGFFFFGVFFLFFFCDNLFY